MLKKILLSLIVLSLITTPISFAKTPWSSKPPIGSVVDWSHPLSRGPVAVFLMNEGGGNLVRDLVRGNNGTLNLATWTNSIKGKAINFSGVQDCRVIIPHNANLNLTTTLTILMWVKDSDYTGIQDYVFEKGVSRYAIIYGYTARKFELYCEGYTGDDPRTALTTSLADNNWHCVAFTLNGSGVTGYFDGKLDVFNSGSTTLGTDTTNAAIGASQSGGQPYEGQVSLTYLYNRALSPSEIQQLYQEPYCFIKPQTDWNCLKAAVAAAGGWVQYIFFNSAEEQ